jgi:phosphomevalonate kinase
VKVSVPGKVVLLGEYAVTEGGPALVAATSVRAWGETTRRSELDSPVVREVRRAAGGPETPIFIDTSSFRDPSGAKYGFGSSSATAVCAAALFIGDTGEEVLQVALAGHREAAGGGSGIDVAACYCGGVIAAGRQPGPVEAMPSRLPGFELAIFRLGPPVSTSDFVRRCRASADWRRWVEVLRGLADEGMNAYLRGRADPFRSAIERFARALDGLGRSAGVPIITDEARALGQAARSAGGVAKPSGAGGGDVAIAWLPTDVDAEAVAVAAGVERLPVRVDTAGLRRETPR